MDKNQLKVNDDKTHWQLIWQHGTRHQLSKVSDSSWFY